MAKKTDKPAPANIAQNKKAWHDYFIEQKFEAGLALEGWEVKSLRAGRAQLKESYVVVENAEVWLIGAVERKGYTLVPLSLYWKRGKAKLEIGLAKGKQQHDKRAALKDRERAREAERAMKSH